jgi:hypothetical protein
MKSFFKNFAIAIPLALGIVLTIFCVVNAMSVLTDNTAGATALFCGLFGIPLLYASMIALMKDRNV